MKLYIASTLEELFELGISKDEILISEIFKCGSFKKDIARGFRGDYKGRTFYVDHSKTEHREEGSSFLSSMMGKPGKVIGISHEYSLEIAASPDGYASDGIKYRTGSHSEAVDNLLEDLFWYVSEQHHNTVVDQLLE